MSNNNNDDFQYYRYHPSAVAAILFTVLFFLFTFLHLYQLVRTRTWVFIPFFIGGLFEGVGYVGRIIATRQTPNWTLGPFVQQSLLLLVAPALFAASIYMLLGRIILLTDGEKHSVIRKWWLTKSFVTGDVLSFLAVGAGGGILAGGGKNYNLGNAIIEVGLALQIAFFGFFVITAGIFHRRMNRNPTAKVLAGGVPWKKHMSTLYVASTLILIRSVFRVIEYSEGYKGYLLSREVYLYVFDGVLMLSVMVVFAWIHPSEIYAMLKGGPDAKAIRHGVEMYSLDSRKQDSR